MAAAGFTAWYFTTKGEFYQRQLHLRSQLQILCFMGPVFSTVKFAENTTSCPSLRYEHLTAKFFVTSN